MLLANFWRYHFLIRGVAALYFLWSLTQNREIFFRELPQEYLLLGFLLENLVAATIGHYAAKRPSLGIAVIALDVLAGAFFVLAFRGAPVWLAFMALPVLAGVSQSFRVSILTAFLQFAIYAGVLQVVAGRAPDPSGARSGAFPVESAFLAFVIFLALSFAGLFKDIHDEKARQGDSLLSLIEAGQELGTTVTYETVFNLMSTIVKGLFACHTCVIYLRDSREEMLKLKFADSPYEKLFIDFDSQASKSLVAEAIKERKAVATEDIQLRSDEELLPKAALMRSVAAVPFVFQGGVFGAMVLAHRAPRRFTGENLGMVMILGNQAAISLRNIQLHEATATMAVTDSVSGLYTHGYFQDHLEREFQRCKYGTLPLSLLILDVDFFKRVNDTYGHPQGDAILRQLGGVIKSVTRLTDVICRYGGDEFTVTLPETNRIGAVLVAERIRQAVEEYEFVSGGKVLHISVSGGVASFPEDIATKKELIEKSDQALYEAKKQGRNRICFSA